MQKFLLSGLLCVTFGLIVPLTALAADASTPEEADYVLKMSRQVIQEITSTDSAMLDVYITEFENQKQTAVASGLKDDDGRVPIEVVGKEVGEIMKIVQEKSKEAKN